MAADPDDEALAWAGDSDPSHVEGPREPKRDPGDPAEATDAAVADAAAQPEEKKPTSSVLLVGYGVLAGVYLLYALGWIIAVQRSTLTYADLFTEIMYQFGEFLAIVSPVLWFAAVFLLTRNCTMVTRLLWLVAGVVVLIPWPFLLGGA